LEKPGILEEQRVGTHSRTGECRQKITVRWDRGVCGEKRNM
jgi:hypothetical protein